MTLGLKLFGIETRVHWSFWLLPAFIYWKATAGGMTSGQALVACSFVFVLFGCVLLHEFGHALTARRFGIGTKHITLYPIGGVAGLERIPRDPMQELIVIVNGPLVNVALYGIFYVLGLLFPVISSLCEMFMFFNLMMVVFNLIPAFPMDGGRILRALIAMVSKDYLFATKLAAYIGVACAVGFFAYGVTYGQPMLCFISLFVALGALGEKEQVERENAQQ